MQALGANGASAYDGMAYAPEAKVKAPRAMSTDLFMCINGVVRVTSMSIHRQMLCMP